MNIELSAICRHTAPLALLALAWGCGSETSSDEARIGSARAAVEALTERDDASVGVCNAAAARCSAELPDAAGGTACTRLTEQCERLAEQLATVRDPAVSCWRGIEACLQHAPEGTSCPTAESCESLDDDVEIERDPVVQCGERVQACLSRAAEVPESGAACDQIAASCERIGAGDGADEDESVEEEAEDAAEAAEEEEEDAAEAAEEDAEGAAGTEGAEAAAAGRARADAARAGAASSGD